MSNHVSVRLEMVLVSVQDRCMICAKRTIGSETILDAPMVLLGGEAQVQAHFGLLRDRACRRTHQFIRVQVQWQPASGRTVILEPI